MVVMLTALWGVVGIWKRVRRNLNVAADFIGRVSGNLEYPAVEKFPRPWPSISD